jgi:hypothetical protein
LLRANSAEAKLFDYTRSAYTAHIVACCDAAWPPPDTLARKWVKRRGQRGGAKGGLRKETRKEWQTRLGPAKWAQLLAWQAAHRWGAHQLRHNHGTNVRNLYGREAAAGRLNHGDLKSTDRYTRTANAMVLKIAREIG